VRIQLIDEVVFDGSTRPGTVELNGFRLRFESDGDAKAVFDLLNRQRDANKTLVDLLLRVRSEVRGLARDIEDLT
jgi:hypothetical protein